MKGTILCVGGILDESRRDRLKNYLTCPSPGGQAYEAHRKYTFAPMGELHRYASNRQIVTRIVEKCDAQYGLVVIDDFFIRDIQPSIEPAEFGQKHSFITEFHEGTERAKDLAQQWQRYGAVLVAGEVPTVAEIEKAWQQRRDYALARVDEVSQGQTLRRQGTKGYKQGADPADEMWALEFNLPFSHSLSELMRGAPVKHEVECPFCFEQIDARAMKCRHCSSTFQKQSAGAFLAKEVIPDEKRSDGHAVGSGVRG